MQDLNFQVEKKQHVLRTLGEKNWFFYYLELNMNGTTVFTIPEFTHRVRCLFINGQVIYLCSSTATKSQKYFFT
jgi:hypothetical protein